MFQVRNLVVGDIQDAEAGIGFQTSKVCNGVVGKVEFFKVGESRESGYVC